MAWFANVYLSDLQIAGMKLAAKTTYAHFNLNKTKLVLSPTHRPGPVKYWYFCKTCVVSLSVWSMLIPNFSVGIYWNTSAGCATTPPQATSLSTSRTARENLPQRRSVSINTELQDIITLESYNYMLYTG